ncbi:hypothetical protein PF003_g26107 [Phytophthora fragariae]|nr:hypothetical protein PF003_g26107 [Phytophthora fragariae]
MLAHGSERNMVPAALVILGMISVLLLLLLVVRLWDHLRESRQVPRFGCYWSKTCGF